MYFILVILKKLQLRQVAIFFLARILFYLRKIKLSESEKKWNEILPKMMVPCTYKCEKKKDMGSEK